MGVEYKEVYICSLLLFIVDTLLLTQEISNNILVLKNKVKKQSYGYIIMAILCIGISLLLVSSLGALGSSIAIAISYLYLFAYLFRLYKTELNLDILTIFVRVYKNILISIMVASIIAYVLCDLILLKSLILQIIIKILVVTIIYILCIFFALNNFEKNFLKKRLFILKN